MSYGFRALTVFLACAATAGVVCLSRLGHEAPSQAREIVTLLETGHYDEAEIAARAQLSALRRSYAASSVPVAHASDVLVRALRLNGKASQPETLQLAERTVLAKRRHRGDVHAETAISLLNLGQVLGDRGDLTRAISELQRTLKIREQLGSSDLDVAEALDALGSVFTIARSYDAALAVLDRSRKAKKRALPPNHPGLRVTLETAAAALQAKGDYAAAREHLDLASATGEPVAGHPSRVTTLNLLAMQLWFEGDLRRSRDVALDALQLARQRMRPDHPEIARTLQILAATIDDLGDMDASLRYREQALAVAQRSLGDTHYELAGYLNDLGNLNLILGAYTDARAQFEQALQIATAGLPPEHDWIPTIVHNLALVDARLGDFESARRQHARAIEMWERALGPNHSYIALALTEVATVLREQGAASEALPLYERALAIRQHALGPDHRDTGFTLIDIAATLSQMGQKDRAQEFAARALALWERIDTSDSPSLATVLKLYADLQFARGAFNDARRYFERSLAIRRKAFGPSHPDVAGVQVALALTDARLGNESEALETALQAETSGRDHLRLISRYLPERQALSYAVSRPRALDLILSLARTESASVALDAVIRGRALVLDEMATRRHGVTAAAEALGPLQAQLSTAEQRLANLLVRGPTQQTSNQYLSLVDAARQDKEDAERALAARSASFREQLNQAQSGLRELRASLPAETALVSFVRFSRSPSRAGATSGLSQPLVGIPAYVAFVLRPDRNPSIVQLGGAQQIEDLIGRWRSDVAAAATQDGLALRSATQVLRGTGQSLRAAVWDPVATHLTGVRMVFVVPDGALSLVPLVALPGHTSEFLLDEGPVVHYLSAERDLVASSPRPSVHRLLALGGADFDGQISVPQGSVRSTGESPLESTQSRGATSKCVGFDGIQFPALSDTLAEVQDVARLWSGRTPSAVGSVRVLAGNDASERTLKREAHNYQVLHLATHGFFLGGLCQPGAAGMRAVGGLIASSPFGTTVLNGKGENPLLLSGLAFAGANRRAAVGPEEDDGILTAEEVASLNLTDTEWAVLSACDTGVGEIKAGEGVFGLRRAFRIAGARTVIMSLWPVDDRATRVWMRALYDGRLNEGLNTADALREASLAVLRDRRATGQSTHPFYWAAFVAAGDWR